MITKSESFVVDHERFAAISGIGEEILACVERNDWLSGYIAGNKLRISHDLGLVDQFIPGTGLVVDIGAIPPLLLTALTRRYPELEIEGLDLDPDRFADAIQALGVTIKRADIENQKLPYADNSVDLIVFNEIFEHLRQNLPATFREIHRIVKPGGLILMSTPNGLSASSIVRMIRRRKIGPSISFEYGKLERVGHMGHVREYAIPEVLEFMEDMNFEVPQIVYRGRYHHRWVDRLLRVFPSFRPYVSFVIKKPDAASGVL